MAIYLKNANYIDWQTLKFTKTNIIVEKSKPLVFIDENSENETATQADIVINCEGKYVTKSFGCGHHHIYSALACGMPAPKEKLTGFYEILKYVWWNIDTKLTKEMILASAYATGIELVKNGVTFVIDHHASPNCVDGSLNYIAEALNNIGISYLLSYEITDRDGEEKMLKGLAENERYIKQNQGLIGVHASFTINNKTLKKIADLSEKYNAGIHIHVAEDYYDQHFCLKEYKKYVIERLKDVNLINNSKNIFAHAIYLNDKERSILATSKDWIALNSESNQNNKVGKFSAYRLGENIMLGTDGMHSDMIRSAKANYFEASKVDEMSMEQMYKRFRNVNNYLKINDFAGDDQDNLVVLDYKPRTEFNQTNFLGHFAFAMNSSDVQHVIAKGELIMKDRVLTRVNETELLNFSKQQSKMLWNELKK